MNLFGANANPIQNSIAWAREKISDRTSFAHRSNPVVGRLFTLDLILLALG
jgi:hypothetical protein